MVSKSKSSIGDNPKRIKWSSAFRAENNWPIYVFTFNQRQPYLKRAVSTIIDELKEWAETNFSGHYMVHVMDRDYMALIAIEDERDAIRTTLWHNHADVAFTRLKKQVRHQNGHA